MTPFRIVIPARLRSSRLPEKALADLGGKPLVVRVWEQAMRSGAEEVWVATDDERIAAVVRTAGGNALLTSPDHPSGTDRLAEVVAELQWGSDAIVVNWQGMSRCCRERLFGRSHRNWPITPMRRSPPPRFPSGRSRSGATPTR